MAYTKQEWLDHIVDPELEEIIQQGTPVTANRMGHIENGIFFAHEIADAAKNMAASLTVKVAVMMGAQFGGVSGNMILEDMTDSTEIQIDRGVYDQDNQRIYAQTADGQEVVLLGYGAAYE